MDDFVPIFGGGRDVAPGMRGGQSYQVLQTTGSGLTVPNDNDNDNDDDNDNDNDNKGAQNLPLIFPPITYAGVTFVEGSAGAYSRSVQLQGSLNNVSAALGTLKYMRNSTAKDVIDGGDSITVQVRLEERSRHIHQRPPNLILPPVFPPFPLLAQLRLTTAVPSFFAQCLRSRRREKLPLRWRRRNRREK